MGKALWNSSQNYACFHVSLVDHALGMEVSISP